MHSVVYHLAVIAIAAIGVVRGYRKGFTGMLSTAIGLAFGIVCARLFCDPVQAWLEETFPERAMAFGSEFLFSMAASGGIFCVVTLLMQSLTRLLNVSLSAFSSGVLNSLMGTLLCVVKYLLFMSVAYNLIADWNPRESQLLRYATYHDGNVVEAVMKMAPATLGLPGVEELAHRVQLEEAKKIS